MESAPSESPSSLTFKSKKSHIFTTNTPQKPPASPSVAIITPERSDPLPRIRNQNFTTKARKLSLAGSDLLDLDRTTEKLPTSEDATQKIKSFDESATLLPEKYEILCEFFNAMVSSIRLLRLRRLPSTFTTLSRNINSLTDRRFSLHHLAQLKHVMPEVIMIRKIRVQDEETHCMKEELIITLDVEAVEVDRNEKGTARFAHLKGIFWLRITDYSINHPEGDDIPDGELPQLFYKAKLDPDSSMNSNPTSMPLSHIAPSFKGRFLSRASAGSAPEFYMPKPSSCLPETPIKKAVSTNTDNVTSGIIADIKGTAVKLASTPARPTGVTPALPPPKRALRSPDYDDFDDLTYKSVRLSLNFDKSIVDLEDQLSQSVDDKANAESSHASMDVLNLLPKHLVQSLGEKERKIMEEQDPIISQARRREQLMAGVPKLFDMICLLFQSVGRSIITKEELIHKLVAGHLDIVDRREVEEQLNLLLEVAPEYMSEKSCLSGDIVLRLNKYLCHESIRQKLLEAK